MAPIKYGCSQVNLTSKKLGQGAFGTVYKGSVNGKPVAVKINTVGELESTQEINRMKYLDHENIVVFLGTVPPAQHGQNCYCASNGLTVDTSWIVMEFVELGSLLENLPKFGLGDAKLWEPTKCKIAYQVSLGMEYLHTKADIIHMDLAARNVLVREMGPLRVKVKIGDFGKLCDDKYADQYMPDVKGNLCPVRWMPPENLPLDGRKGRFTKGGDVWAFGILLFEIWSNGQTPYQGFSNDEVMKNVESGEVVFDREIDFQRKTPRWVIELMWEMCFERRSNFEDISEAIRQRQIE